MDEAFDYAWTPISHLLGVRNSDALRKAHETVLGDMVAFGLKVQQSEAIYQGLKALRNGPTWDQLQPAQQRAVDLKLRDAELSGVGLEDEYKHRFNQINRELSQLSTDFSNHVLDATKAYSLTITDPADTAGWPTTLKQLAAQAHQRANAENKSETPATAETGPWRITLDHPVMGPFLQHSRRRDQREAVYRAFITRASAADLDNTPLIQKILQLRKEKAQLLGFDSYAQLSLESKMAPDVPAVEEMFRELLSASRPFAEQEFKALQQMASAGGQSEPLQHWDMAFWSERLREKEFNITDEQLRPYFPMPRVLQGLFELSERLFGIRIQQADGQAPVWHDDVRFFQVTDADGTPLASFYLDPYSRPAEKRGGAWMSTCLNRRKSAAGLRLPVVHLCCNGTPPVGDRPSLMSFSEVNTLFHEFGHGLQSMLTTVDFTDVAGLGGIDWDAVEIASQFMENWCYHRPTLLGMTAHVETGEPLPDELFEKLLAAKNFNTGTQMIRQLRLGMTDMQLHQHFNPMGVQSPFELAQQGAATTSILPPLPEDRFLCSFTHIFAGGYAAGYYSYKWSEVLSADAFSAFEDVGLDHPDQVAQLGRKYRSTILSLGGSRPPMEVFESFRGRPPLTHALLRHCGLWSGPDPDGLPGKNAT